MNTSINDLGKTTSLTTMQARDIHNVGTVRKRDFSQFSFSSRSNFNPEFRRRFWVDYFPFSKVNAILKDQTRVFVIQFVFSRPIWAQSFASNFCKLY